jgi:hypothetical protein
MILTMLISSWWPRLTVMENQINEKENSHLNLLFTVQYRKRHLLQKPFLELEILTTHARI